MASTKTVRFHRTTFSMDNETLRLARELAKLCGLPVSSVIRQAVHQAHRQELIARKELQQPLQV